MVSNFFIFMVFCLLFKDGQSAEVVFAEEGSPVVLPCKWTPQTVSPAVIWSNSKGSVWKMLKSGLQLWNVGWLSRVKCPHTQFTLGDYSLQIQSIRAEDAGIYSCTLELDNINRPVTTNIELRVITVSISPAAPIMRQSVTVSCDVSGGEWPGGSRVQWTLNGSPYEAQKTVRGHYRKPRETALSFKAAESVRGTWTCVVTYKKREWRTSALLDVKGIIQPPNDSTKIYAAVGSAVTLPCVFSNDLTPSNALWERIHNITTSKPALGKLPPSFSAPVSGISPRDKMAALGDVRFEDAGWYRCSASVEGFRLERRMQLVTAKVEVEVLSMNEPSLTLTCQLSDTSDVTEYEWIYTASDLSGNRFVASVQKGRNVTLSQASDGQWTCRFYGKQGVLGNVTYDIQHMSAERLSEEKPAVVSHDAAVLIGLGLLLLILLLTLNQMYRNYQRRKKMLQFPALETIIHNRSVEQEMMERNQTKQ